MQVSDSGQLHVGESAAHAYTTADEDVSAQAVSCAAYVQWITTAVLLLVSGAALGSCFITTGAADCSSLLVLNTQMKAPR